MYNSHHPVSDTNDCTVPQEFSALRPPLSLRLKSALIRTPLERPVLAMRDLMMAFMHRRHPELSDVYAEGTNLSKIMRKVLVRESNCIDVGSHLGSVLSEIFRISPQGQHTAIEPVPYKAVWLQKRFPEATIHAVACGERNGIAVFNENRVRSGYSSLALRKSGDDHVIRYQVPLRQLDDLIDSRSQVHFVKIDTEGGELPVLRGFQTSIKRCKPMIAFESAPGGSEPFGYVPRELFDYLTVEFGYAIYRLGDFLSGKARLSPEEFIVCHQWPFRAFNFIAV